MRVPVGGFRSVVFDCDSTLVAIEGIDHLAGERLEEIRAMTDRAMDGSVALQDVYGRRLELLNPPRERVLQVGEAYVESLVEDARETVAALLWLGKTVRIVSGGLRPPVERVARELGLAPEHVAAVGITFGDAGDYRGFERESPLARAGGKLDLLRGWTLPRPALLVGDGATDLEARDAVDCFAAFMGVVHRPRVAAAADVVLGAPSLAPVLALAADDTDRERLRGSPYGDVLAQGERLLRTAGAPGADA